MKTSPFAKGLKARPDTTSSEKRTALDRLNAIDGMVAARRRLSISRLQDVRVRTLRTT